MEQQTMLCALTPAELPVPSSEVRRRHTAPHLTSRQLFLISAFIIDVQCSISATCRMMIFHAISRFIFLAVEFAATRRN
jgi:hypothetical protein